MEYGDLEWFLSEKVLQMEMIRTISIKDIEKKRPFDTASIEHFLYMNCVK